MGKTYYNMIVRFCTLNAIIVHYFASWEQSYSYSVLRTHITLMVSPHIFMNGSLKPSTMIIFLHQVIIATFSNVLLFYLLLVLPNWFINLQRKVSYFHEISGGIDLSTFLLNGILFNKISTV